MSNPNEEIVYDDKIGRAQVGIIGLSPFVSKSASRASMQLSELSNRPTCLKCDVGGFYSGVERLLSNNTFKQEIPNDSKLGYTIHKIINTPESNNLYLINNDTLELDVLELKPYALYDQRFGFTYINTRDKSALKEGNIIASGTILGQSPSITKKDAYNYGFSGRVAMCTDVDAIEDTIIVSESYAKKISYQSFAVYNVTLKADEILLPIDRNGRVAALPVVGDKIQASHPVIATRTVSKEAAVSVLAPHNINKLDQFSDNIHYSTGVPYEATVVEVVVTKNKTRGNVLCDSYTKDLVKHVEMNKVNSTIFQDMVRDYKYFCRKKSVEPGYTTRCNQHIVNTTMVNDPRVALTLKNAILPPYSIKVVIRYDIGLHIGSKMAGGHGDKGVISGIIPDDQMHKDPDGVPLDIVVGISSGVNREIPSVWIDVYIRKVIANAQDEIRSILKAPTRRVTSYLNTMYSKDKATILSAYDYLLSLLVIISPPQHTVLLSYKGDKDKIVETMATICTTGLQVLLTVDILSRKLPREMYYEIEKSVHKPSYGKFQIYNRKLEAHEESINDGFAGVAYMMPLIQDATVDLSASSSYALQSQGRPGISVKTDKYCNPVKVKVTSLSSLDEVSQLSSVLDPLAMATLYSRNNDPKRHKHIMRNKLSNPDSGKQYRLDSGYKEGLEGPSLKILKNLLHCYGCEMYYD